MGSNPLMHCLETLSSFELYKEFCSDLMKSEGYTDLKLNQFPEVDTTSRAHYYSETILNTVIICCFGSDWKKSFSEILRITGSLRNSIERIVIVTNSLITASEFETFENCLNSHYSFQMEFYDLFKIRNVLLDNHKHLISEHPEIFSNHIIPIQNSSNLLQVRIAVDCQFGKQLQNPKSFFELSSQIIFAIECGSELNLQFEVSGYSEETVHKSKTCLGEIKQEEDSTKLQISTNHVSSCIELLRTSINIFVSDDVFGYFYYEIEQFESLLLALFQMTGILEQPSWKNKVAIWMEPDSNSFVVVEIPLLKEEVEYILGNSKHTHLREFVGDYFKFTEFPPGFIASRIYPAILVKLATMKLNGEDVDYYKFLDIVNWNIGGLDP